MISTLEELLPEAKLSKQPSGGGTPAGVRKRSSQSSAAVVYDDGHGKAALSVSLGRQNPEEVAEGDLACPDKNFTPSRPAPPRH